MVSEVTDNVLSAVLNHLPSWLLLEQITDTMLYWMRAVFGRLHCTFGFSESAAASYRRTTDSQ